MSKKCAKVQRDEIKIKDRKNLALDFLCKSQLQLINDARKLELKQASIYYLTHGPGAATCCCQQNMTEFAKKKQVANFVWTWAKSEKHKYKLLGLIADSTTNFASLLSLFFFEAFEMACKT